jgi:hypothetical protein
VRDGRSEVGSSAANGAYVVIGLDEGAWEVRASADGYVPIEESCVLDGRPWQSADLVLRPWTAVPVRFVDREGRPMERANLQKDLGALEIVATEEPLDADLRPSDAQSYSGFGLARWLRAANGVRGRAGELATAGYAGELQIHRDPPVVATLLYRHLRLATQRVELGQEELVFTIDPAELAAKRGRVRLRVLDATTSAPLAGLGISARAAGRHHGSTITDAEGRAVLQDVLPGIALITVDPPEREELRLHVRVPDGREVDLGDLRLSPRVSCKGRVLRADGSPAEGVSISWCPEDLISWPAPLHSGLSTSSGRDGRFEFHAGSRRYRIYAHSRQGERAHGLADPTDPSSPEIVLRLGAAAHVKLSYDARACAGCLLVLETSEGLPVAQVLLDGTRRNRSTELPPGRYVAKVLDAFDALVRARPFEVTGDTLELALP